MDKFDYDYYDIHRAGLKEDHRKAKDNELSEARASALNDMLRLILEHKKEITKIPQASTLRGAEEWASKRGFTASLEDIGGDDEKEVVVYDKGGRPFMVNGYKLKPSDYGIRKAYWEANPTSEDRAATPMKEWAQDYVWHEEEDPTNMWNSTVSKNEANYNKMHEWGYRMPTKPKTEMSPYSIFSKLIAPIVKGVIASQNLIDKINAKSPISGVSNAGAACCEFIRKLVSPISFYRYLYMRLVEQKFLFSLHATESTRHFATSYDKYKHYLKNNKKTFRKWFIDNILAGDKKEKFNDAWVNPQVVLDALVKNDIDWNGSDILDGLVFLIGPSTLTVPIGNEGRTAAYLLCDNVYANDFLKNLKDKKADNHKPCKKLLEKLKKLSQQSIDKYFKDDKVKTHFFFNAKALNAFTEGVKAGVPNATDAQSASQQKRLASGPASRPTVQNGEDEEQTTAQMLGMTKPSYFGDED